MRTITPFAALLIVLLACGGSQRTAELGASATPGPSGGEPACPILPPDNPWNTDISEYPLHPLSDTYVDHIGRDTHLHPDFGTVWAGAPIGIPYVIVDGDQPKVPVTFDYDGESDPGPYPIPPDAPIEGGPSSDGDRHVIVIDDDNCLLYETFYSRPQDGGAWWEAGSGAIFDLSSNDLRPDYWTSADAAGLPIFPGLARYEEIVEQGLLDHALRFTVSQSRKAFIHPATHYASSSTDPNRPPMGLRVRMKASYDCSWASAEVQVICAGLKTYGLFVADNGSNWYVSGAPDPRWDNEALGDLKDITGDAFEAVCTGPPITQSGELEDPCESIASPTPSRPPTASPEPTPVPTPTQTPTPQPTYPLPTATPTPTPTQSPVPTPTSTPTDEPRPTASPTTTPLAAIWGDDNCDGVVDSLDAMRKLIVVSGGAVASGDECFEIGESLVVDGAGRSWGDVKCDGAVNTSDSVWTLRWLAVLATEPPTGCPAIGALLHIPA